MGQSEPCAPITVECCYHRHSWLNSIESHIATVVSLSPCTPNMARFIQPSLVNVNYSFSFVEETQELQSKLLTKHQVHLRVGLWRKLFGFDEAKLAVLLQNLTNFLLTDLHLIVCHNLFADYFCAANDPACFLQLCDGVCYEFHSFSFLLLFCFGFDELLWVVFPLIHKVTHQLRLDSVSLCDLFLRQIFLQIFTNNFFLLLYWKLSKASGFVLARWNCFF